MGVIADGDNEVEIDTRQLADVFRAVTGDVDARLEHHPDGSRIEPTRFHTGGIRFDDVPFQRPRPPFRHLAAARVSRAKKENPGFLVTSHHESLALVPDRSSIRPTRSAIWRIIDWRVMSLKGMPDHLL